MAFGAAVGTVAFLAQNPWLIPLLAGLGLAGSAALRRWQTARNTRGAQLHTQNDVGRKSGMRRLPELARLGRDNLAGALTDAERKQGVAVCAYGSAAMELNDTGTLSPDTAERLVQVRGAETLVNRGGLSIGVFDTMLDLQRRTKTTTSGDGLRRDLQQSPLPPNPGGGGGNNPPPPSIDPGPPRPMPPGGSSTPSTRPRK